MRRVIYHNTNAQLESDYELTNKPFRTLSFIEFVKKYRHKFLAIVILWTFTLIYCEIVVFSSAIGACNWREVENSTKVIIISDPQLTDAGSYSYATRGSLILSLIEFYSDIYMKKAYSRVQSKLTPDAVFFLGDLFDGAKILTDDEYIQEFKRFNWVFAKTRKMKVYNVSGNHDIGYRLPFVQPKLIRKFRRYGQSLYFYSFMSLYSHFGELNYKVKLDAFTFVVISSLTLQPFETDLDAYTQTKNFLASIKAEGTNSTSIQLTLDINNFNTVQKSRHRFY